MQIFLEILYLDSKVILQKTVQLGIDFCQLLLHQMLFVFGMALIDSMRTLLHYCQLQYWIQFQRSSPQFAFIYFLLVFVVFVSCSVLPFFPVLFPFPVLLPFSSVLSPVASIISLFLLVVLLAIISPFVVVVIISLLLVITLILVVVLGLEPLVVGGRLAHCIPKLLFLVLLGL